MEFVKLKNFLDLKVKQFNSPQFIERDPISIPHKFKLKQDIEFMGFIAATLAWGQRTTIINNCNKLIDLMDGEPYQFLIHHKENELKKFLGFVHRTFNDTDLLSFIDFFSNYYKNNESIEHLFSSKINKDHTSTELGIINFYDNFFSHNYPARTKKHIANPLKGSACKRINMFLRWMVRKDEKGVDFGIWKNISMSQLVCPLDTHVHRVSLGLGLIKSKQANWNAAIELTEKLKEFDPLDPVKYDYALFSLGAEEKF